MKPDKWQVAHKETHSAYLPGHPLLLPTPAPWQRLNILCTHRDHQLLALAMRKSRSLQGFPSLSVVKAVGVEGAQPAASWTGHPGHCERASHEAHGQCCCLMSHQMHKPPSCPLQLFLSQGSADLTPFLHGTKEEYLFLPDKSMRTSKSWLSKRQSCSSDERGFFVTQHSPPAPSSDSCLFKAMNTTSGCSARQESRLFSSPPVAQFFQALL